MEYLCKYEVYRVKILQGWCAARNTICDSGYDVTVTTYSLQVLYLSKMKNAFLLLQSLTDFLVLVLRNVDHLESSFE